MVRPTTRIMLSFQLRRSASTTAATASTTSSKTAGGSESANGRRSSNSPSRICCSESERPSSRTEPSLRTRLYPVGAASSGVCPDSRRISGYTSESGTSSGSATSIRLFGAATVTRQNPVAETVLT